MPFYAAQMTINMTSNVAADAVVNTMHFSGANPVVDLPDIQTAMFAFYNDIRPMYSTSVRQNDHVLKVYDLDDVKPRVPALEVDFDFTSAPSGNILPHQVALCLSFQAVKISGIAQARRRGRIYIGPLSAAQVTGGGRPNAAAIASARDAGDNLLTTTTPMGIVWGVFSPTDANLYAIANGWVDDRYDIQRRRARDAVARSVFP